MNNNFTNITKNLNLKPLDKNKFDISENFYFKEVSKDDVRKEIRNTNVKK